MITFLDSGKSRSLIIPGIRGRMGGAQFLSFADRLEQSAAFASKSFCRDAIKLAATVETEERDIF